MMYRKIVLFVTLFFFFSAVLHAQQPVKDTLPFTTGKLITIIQADRYNFQDKDSLGKFISLAGNAKVQQERTYFSADSIVLNQKDNTLEAFGNVHINDADSIQTYAQYVKYLGKEKHAFLKNKVTLTDGKGVLTTNELEYDVNTRIGTYYNGGKVVNGKTVLTSKEGIYNGNNRDVLFKKKVVLIDPDYKIITDTLLYNLNTEQTTFLSPTTIYNGKRIIKTKEGYYDLKNKRAYFGKRPLIDDSTYTLTADSLNFYDATGLATMHGGVQYKSKDTVGGYDLFANHLIVDRKKNAFTASEHPVLVLKQEKDSVYITADTLYSAKMSQLKLSITVPNVRDTIPVKKGKEPTIDSANDRFFQAYHHVKIFSDSLQAVGDSMFYALSDSTFRLFQHPIVWAEDNQLVGDTIYLFLKNKKPERLKVFENAIAISKVSEDLFNQVSGRTINGYFDDNGDITLLQTKGNPAQNVYYAADESKRLVGVNQSTSDAITVRFKGNQPQRVVFLKDLKGTLFPMRQVDHESIKVKHFSWQIDKRPKSKFELLGNAIDTNSYKLLK